MAAALPSESVREAEARLTRARLDAMDHEDPADVLAHRAEADKLQREVDATSVLVHSLRAEAEDGLREVTSTMDGLREESWRVSAFLQLEALKEQIIAGDGDGAMAAFEALELQEEGASARQAAPPSDELQALLETKERLEAELAQFKRELDREGGR
ncbi:hypothetical protein T492DRAFT_847679 [Pavlovales sp. CCMP2436]|nr:hypothetical protein T492DRAFT_847679 [Pavlovales sp. CCMP2436]